MAAAVTRRDFLRAGLAASAFALSPWKTLERAFEVHNDLLPSEPAVRDVGREEDRLMLPSRS